MDMDEEQIDEAQYEELSSFLRRAVSEALRLEDGTAFQAWMREEAPRLLPDLFSRLPDEQARRGFLLEFGRSLWNSIPLPANGFRPRPIPQPERNDPCPCGLGKKYKKCCAEWSEGAPELDPEGVWMLVAEELPLEQVEAMGASGRVPRSVLGGVATGLLDNDDPERALALVRPLFERPEKLDERDAASLNTLLEAYDALDLREELWQEGERLAQVLRPPLRAVLWEGLARAYAVEGEMEEAWKSLERARQDDPESPALGPLEVSLLLAEGRTAEAGERARHWRSRLREDELSEAGFEFLARVGENPEETQLRFSFGDEVTERIHELEERL
ncbi:MAG TPA: SEC-C metal-binding domain-containing protein, partial [Thermoanaerobaculia bacterium]